MQKEANRQAWLVKVQEQVESGLYLYGNGATVEASGE
jgi:hypothetical protein